MSLDVLDRIDTPSLAYQRMEQKWRLVHDLLGGTQAMRDAGHRWLPKEERESERNYVARLSRSFLYNAYGDTLDKLTAKPFSRPVTVKGDLPDRLVGMDADMNRAGSDLTGLLKELFRHAINYGMCHALVDYPAVGDGLTVADERAADLRPVVTVVTPPQLLGAEVITGDNGQETLAEVRIKEARVERVGRWREVEVDYIRVIRQAEWELWRKGPGDEEYAQVDEGRHTFGGVPLVTVYTNRVGALEAEPALEDLAWLNLSHWQSDSDQNNILRFARIGILFAAGFSREEVEEGITISPNALTSSSNPEAKLSYVEHSGRALTAGKEHVRDLEARMEVLGLQPLLGKVQSTATGIVRHESGTQLNIQSWIRNLESTAVRLFDMAAHWVGAELPDDFDIDVFNDFGLTDKAQQDIDSLIKIRQGREIAHATFLHEIKRRGILSELLDVEAEMDLVAQEGPTLGGID